MPDYKRIELLVKVAKLYYENDYSQEMIAKKLGLSRPYISKLLNESKSNGIVKVQVIDPLSIETPLEKNLREHFGLEKVRIVPMSEELHPFPGLDWKQPGILIPFFRMVISLAFPGVPLFTNVPRH